MSDLVVEDIRKALQEDEGKDVVLELRGVERPTNLTSSIPEPLLQCGDIKSRTSIDAHYPSPAALRTARA
jgi:hypothetical protein